MQFWLTLPISCKCNTPLTSASKTPEVTTVFAFSDQGCFCTVGKNGLLLVV